MKSFFLFISFLLLVFATVPRASFANEAPVFTDIAIDRSDTHLLLFASVSNAFTDEMMDGLRSGLPLQFNFYLELYEKQNRRSATKVMDLRLSHRLQYDTLKEQYRLTLESANGKEQIVNNLSDAQQMMSEINGAKIIPLTAIIPGNIYELRLRADLYKKTLPSGFGIGPLLSLWDIKTEWQHLEFTLR